MIGMINIPNDSPAEFYSAPHHYRHLFDENDPTSSENSKDSELISSAAPTTSKPNFLNLFNRRKNRQQFTYLNDGRKVYNGQVLDASTASKMWEQLIVRTFVHKMEDEIQSPAVQLDTIQEAFPKLSKNKKSLSTYSLVSEDRIKSQCDKCCPAASSNLQSCSGLSKSSCKLENHSHSTVTSTKKTMSPSAKLLRRKTTRSSLTSA